MNYDEINKLIDEHNRRQNREVAAVVRLGLIGGLVALVYWIVGA